MRITRIIGGRLAILAGVVLLLAGCNVFDPVYGDGEVTIDNADAAMDRNDYVAAADLYMQLIVANPSNSRARIGFAAAVVYRDVDVVDIPTLFTSVYSTNVGSTNDPFLANLVGPGKRGIPVATYKTQVRNALSNAAFWRAPVSGIDAVTGVISVGTNGLPVASLSDGWIPAADNTALLNYVVVKGIHVALYVQERFAVAANLLTTIDVSNYTNGWNPATLTNQALFGAWHAPFTNTIAGLSNTYNSMCTLLLGTTANISPFNMLDVATVLVTAVSKSGLTGDALNTAVNGVKDLRANFTSLAVSLTNATGIPAGFDAIRVFRTNVEAVAASLSLMGY